MPGPIAIRPDDDPRGALGRLEWSGRSCCEVIREAPIGEAARLERWAVDESLRIVLDLR